ncbi:hypothetical protein CU097_003355 [Rhizopus azygosporus]|uniref:Arrestin C-terminal-like domain-containing protein n=1 Tax=Rhizopus azygosporus TaxID=86630 RepID=A0A367ISB6_RHIAZ|nr:hypothetical protein CU097_003355 [Rhizopus azygosporus]
MKTISTNKPNAKLRIHLENNHLIMYGSALESSGCVLRGALSLKLKKPTSFKSLSLHFLGKVSVSWNQVGNGYERKFNDTRIVISHTWTFLMPQQKQLHLLSAGIHTFEFDLILPGSLPESTQLDKYYNVDYQLKAVAEKPGFSRNYTAQRDIHLSRQRPNLTTDYYDSIHVTDQWTDKLSCEVSLPTKVYTYGDLIPIKINAVPLKPNLRVLYVSCTFKESITCRAVNGWFNGKNKKQGRIIEYTRKDTSSSRLVENYRWSTSIHMNVPRTITDIQCDVNNESVRVRHKLKLVLFLEHRHELHELRTEIPIIIAITDSIGVLPPYEDIWQTLPYDPLLMLTPSTSSIPPSYHSVAVN